MKSRIFFIFFFILTISATYLQSYVLEGYKWANAQYTYFINPANGDITRQAAITAIKNASNTWAPWCPGTYLGTTTLHTVSNNGKNTVFFRNASSGNAIAATYIYYNPNTHRILDFDMVFYDKAWRFYAGSTGCVQGFYVRDIATHEFGHVIGLDHSHVLAATMYPSAPFCTTQLRTLAQDDINGATAIY